MYDRMLDLEEEEEQPYVLSQWSESSREGRPKKHTPVHSNFKKENLFEKQKIDSIIDSSLKPVLPKELSKNLISPDPKKKLGDSSVGFDTFNPSKKRESLKESKPVMISINEEDSRLQSNMFNTNEFDNSLKNPLDSIQFMTKSDGYHLKKMPKINHILRKRNDNKKTPKWKQHMLNLRKRNRKRKRLQN
jgi:hypothetical protein